MNTNSGKFWDHACSSYRSLCLKWNQTDDNEQPLHTWTPCNFAYCASKIRGWTRLNTHWKQCQHPIWKTVDERKSNKVAGRKKWRDKNAGPLPCDTAVTGTEHRQWDSVWRCWTWGRSAVSQLTTNICTWLMKTAVTMKTDLSPSSVLPWPSAFWHDHPRHLQTHFHLAASRSSSSALPQRGVPAHKDIDWRLHNVPAYTHSHSPHPPPQIHTHSDSILYNMVT